MVLLATQGKRSKMVQTDENPFDGTDEIFEAKQPLKKRQLRSRDYLPPG